MYGTRKEYSAEGTVKSREVLRCTSRSGLWVGVKGVTRYTALESFERQYVVALGER